MSKKWSAAYAIPTSTDYVNRIIGAKFSPSKSSGNPMVDLTCEVHSPEVITITNDKDEEEEITISGVETHNYFVTQVYMQDGKTIDEEKTDNKRKQFIKFWTDMGLSKGDINWDNIDTKPLLGKLILTQMESEPDERRKTPTTAEIATAKKLGKKPEGAIMKNPITGQPLVNYWPKIREIFGLAPQQDGVTVAY